MNHKPDLFLSYAREDAAFALRLAKDLRAAGVSIWIDQLDIDPGERWDDAIERALHACTRMLIVLSPDSVSSENVKDEIAFALRKNKPIVPVLLQACEVPLRIGRLQHIDFIADYQRGLQRLLSSLGLEEKPAARMKEEPPPAPKPHPAPEPIITKQLERDEPVAQWQVAPQPEATAAPQTPPVQQPTVLTSRGQRTLRTIAIWLLATFGLISLAIKLWDIKPQAPEGMTYIPAGEFMMGDSTSDQSDEKPAHRVRVNAFYLDKHEVTVAQFRKFVAATNYKTEAE